MPIKTAGAGSKRTNRVWNNGNPLEAFKDLAADFHTGLTDDLLKGTASDILSEAGELFGVKIGKPISGTLAPEETLDLSALKIQTEVTTEVHQNRPERLFRPSSENYLFMQNERAVEQEIHALIAEIKKEVKRFDEVTQNLERETAKVIVEELPPNPGVYHVNFFEWLLGLLRTMRQKVEDAGAWVTLLQSKRAQKGYWKKFKKHGTSFGLSSERVVATQTG